MAKKVNDEDAQAFTTRQFIETLQRINPEYGERKAYRTLERLQERGRITKVSRGHYTFKTTKNTYRYRPSKQMKQVIRLIETHLPACQFQVWELKQFNEFLEHETGYNALFVEVSHGFEDRVTDLLAAPGQMVLRDPDAKMFHRYRTDDVIVVKRLHSDCPGPVEKTRQSCLEKMLVDLFSRKLTGTLLEHSEYEKILSEAFSRYAINEKAMFRYARRRNLEKQIQTFINEETLIHLMI
ncbi:MAG: hypothetical protein Q4D59_03860 [Erysipelotrichaceae bacterium]|nr:hypothetical protein [Erysipelotrichaceae bacterium]